MKKEINKESLKNLKNYKKELTVPTVDEQLFDFDNLEKTFQSQEPMTEEFTYEEIKEEEKNLLIKFNQRTKRDRLKISKDIVKIYDELQNIQPKDLFTIKRLFNLYNEYQYPLDQQFDYTCQDCITNVYTFLRNVYKRIK